MTIGRKQVTKATVPHLPMGDNDNPGAKFLIAAMFAAGKDSCSCETCQLMARARAEFSSVMLREVKGNGNQDPVRD